MRGLGFSFLIFGVIIYGIALFWAGFLGIQHYLGTAWAVGILAVALFTRFSLPITIGAFYGAMVVWGWGGILSFIFAAPGLALMILMIPGIIAGFFTDNQKPINELKDKTNFKNISNNIIYFLLAILFILCVTCFLYKNTNKSYHAGNSNSTITSVSESKIKPNEDLYKSDFPPPSSQISAKTPDFKKTEKPLSNATDQTERKHTSDLNKSSNEPLKYVLNGVKKKITIPSRFKLELLNKPEPPKTIDHIVKQGKYTIIISDIVYSDKSGKEWVLVDIEGKQGWVAQDILDYR